MEEILAETRKYKLFMLLANQYIRQIDPSIQNSILENTVVKIYGRSDDVELKSLKTGEFNIRTSTTNHGDPVKVFVPGFLVKHRNSMRKADWEKIKEQQVDKYYKKVAQDKDSKTDGNLKDEIKQNNNFKIEKAEGNSFLNEFESNLDTEFNID